MCGGFEGSLPSECPGVLMTPEREDEVYTQGVDFRDGAWFQRAGTIVMRRRLLLCEPQDDGGYDPWDVLQRVATF